ncbi:MAG: T9SS type A sorting domain-containing protein, partial [bacterium]|nr:T9SS type A sorting domain-containing protein [bacterium]
ATPDTLHRVDITFFDSKTSLMSAAGLDKLDNYRNYYLGHIPEGRSRVGQYGRVAVTNLYDGINLQMFADESGIVYYFVIQPGGDPDDLKLDFHGQDSLYLKARNLFVGTSLGDFNLPAPKAFQIDSLGQEVSTTWKPEYSIAGSRVSFSSTGSYDGGKVLVIELRREGLVPPGLTGNLDWCTYIGGSAKGLFQTEIISEAAVDGEDLYLSGLTNNLDFPIQTGPVNNFSDSRDAVLLRFTTEGVLEWGTFYGGSGPEVVQAVLPNGGNVFLGGSSGSNDLPILASGPNAYTNSTLGAGGYQGCIAMFDLEFGFLRWSTYFGDSADNFDQVLDIAKNPNNSNIMVAGTCGGSTDFPLLTSGVGFYETSGNGFLSEFDGENDLIWSTKFGSIANSTRDIEYDSKGNLFITGSDYFNVTQPDPLPVIGSGATYTQSNSSDNLTDAFIAKIDTDRELEWSTYFGGLGRDVGISLTISSNDKLYLAGDTKGGNSSSFPLLSFSSGAYYDSSKDGDDLFIARFSNEGVQEWASFFGGSGNEFFPSLTYDAADNLIVMGGNTLSTDIVTNSPDPSVFEQENLNTNNQSDQRDGFLVTFDANLVQGWTTYFGGYGTNGGEPRDGLSDVEFGNGALFIVGNSGADNPKLPVQDPGGGAYYQPILAGESGIDGFVAKFSIDGGTITAVEDKLQNQNCFNVFPNPFEENIDVVLSNSDGSLSQFRVYDVLGRVLLQGVKNSTSFQIPLINFPKGTYFLEIQNNGKRGIKKLIKQ